jgi:SH3 domain protein
VRSGKTLENRIVRMLLAGTAVEVLEQDPEGYSRIRGPRGTEGWILTRYLSDTPGARERATRSEARVSELEAETRHLAETLTATREEGQAVERRATELVHANASLQTELDALRKAAERPAELARENEQLREAVARAESAAEALGAEVSLLRDGGYRRWFLTGGGVALGGVILGLVLPRLATRRKRSGWDRL